MGEVGRGGEDSSWGSLEGRKIFPAALRSGMWVIEHFIIFYFMLIPLLLERFCLSSFHPVHVSLLR